MSQRIPTGSKHKPTVGETTAQQRSRHDRDAVKQYKRRTEIDSRLADLALKRELEEFQE